MTTDRSLDKALPKDAQVVKQVLRSMGVQDYDPRVVRYLLDFMQGYVARTLQDAEAYAERAGRIPGEVRTEDVTLSIQAQSDYCFAGPPSQEVVLELAEQRNKRKLPELNPQNRHGLRLPPEDQMLVAPNFQLRPPPRGT